MADRKISDLTALTTPASGDYLPIVDISEGAAASKNKRITIEELMRGVPDGTAAAPGIAFETDPNTGIYSPGADQLAVATNGTGRLFVAADGKVGVGTSTPNGLFTVAVATAGTAADFLIGNPANLWSIKTGTTTNALTIVDTQFSAERVRIDSSGNVGIGTASPGTILDVSFAGGMVRAGGVTGNNIIQAYTGSGSVGLGMWAGGAPRFYSTGNMIFSVNSTVGTSFPTGYVDAMTIDSSGRVGIGTSSPGELLHVAGNTQVGWGTYRIASVFDNTYRQGLAFDSSNRQLRIFSTTGDSGGSIGFYTRNGVGVSETDYGTERLRIDSSGNVGIGTSSPSHAIHVSGANAVTSSIQLTTTANSDAAIRSTTALGSFAFGTGIGSATNCWNVYDINATTERLRIDSAGNVGIGTSSPGSKLEIRNDVAATTSLDTTAIKLYNNLDGGSGIEFANAVAGKSKISFGVEGVGAGTNETYLGFSTCLEASALAEGMRLTSAGNVGIGTTSPTTLLDVNADTVRVRTARTPASATATGATGEICWDANYIYVCTATNTWRRSAISSW